MRNEENICQCCTRQRAITTLSLNTCWNQIKQKLLAYLLIAYLLAWLLTDIFTVAIKSIRNMHVVSSNQIADILHFNDNFTLLLLTYSRRMRAHKCPYTASILWIWLTRRCLDSIPVTMGKQINWELNGNR